MHARIGINHLGDKLAPLVAKGLSSVLLFGVVDCEKVRSSSTS